MTTNRDNVFSKIHHEQALTIGQINALCLKARNEQQLMRPAQVLDLIHSLNLRVIRLCDEVKE